MEVIRHAGDLEKHRRAETTKQPDENILHKLTRDELLCIIDLLDLHDKFRLSQTCKAFRLLAKQDWDREFSLLDKEQQKSFLAGLAWQMPNHWMCDGCGELQRLDKADLPQHGRESHNCRQRERILPEWRQYKLRQGHVAMALKLTRMRRPNAGYLRKLMSPFSLRGDALPRESCLLAHGQGGRSRDYRYRVTPKVVSGFYLLKREWEYRSEGTKTDVYRLFLRYYCSHIHKRSRNTWTRALDATGLFDFSALSIRFKDRKPNFLLPSQAPIGVSDQCYDGREIEVSVSCPKCPTDCSFKLSRERSMVHSWHKLDTSSRLVLGPMASRRTTRQGFEEGGVRRMFEEAPESRTDDRTAE